MWARRGTCIQVYGILKDARARRRRRREKRKQARGPRAVRGWGVWWAFGLPEPVWRLLAKSHRGSTGAAHSSKPKPLAAKTGPAPVLLSLAGSSKAFSKLLPFLVAKIPLLGSGVISKAQLLQGINVWHSCLGHFFSSLELRSQLGSYLSFLVHGHIILACKKYTKKCVNSRQNSQNCPK